MIGDTQQIRYKQNNIHKKTSFCDLQHSSFTLRHVLPNLCAFIWTTRLAGKIGLPLSIIRNRSRLGIGQYGLGVEDYLHPKQRLGTLLTHTARIQHDLSQTALKQIQQLGYQASDVQHILVSHLDFDHAWDC